MDSSWTNKSAIMRDLYLAQGRKVPVDINGTLPGDKPSSSHFTEETEEEYFANYVTGENFDSGPDLHLIKNMLDMVREINVDSEEENDDGKELVISKLTSACNTVALQVTSAEEESQVPSINDTVMPKVIKVKRERNVALASILEALKVEKESQILLATESEKAPSDTIKLLKPSDIILGQSEQNIVNKTENGLTKKNGTTKLSTESMKESTKYKIKERVVPTLEPISMFKRKKISPVAKPESVSVKSPPPKYIEKYSPSILATEYYKIYTERNKEKLNLEMDIWMKAEMQMKEIDAKRKKDVESTFSSEEKPVDDDFKSIVCVDGVLLPQHRHQLNGTENCVVCEVLCKRSDATV